MSHWRWIIPLLILSLIGLPAVPKAHAEEIEASVEVLESGVEIMELGSKTWKELQVDAFVSTGDRIRTDETGSALITWFADGTFVEIQPNSELVIEEFSATEEEFVIDASLIQGSVFNSVHRIISPDSTYRINTSNLTATVRGTVFAVALDEDFHTTVAVVEGTVHAESLETSTKFVPVPAGTVFTAISSADIVSTHTAQDFADADASQLQLVTDLQSFYETIPAKTRSLNQATTPNSEASESGNSSAPPPTQITQESSSTSTGSTAPSQNENVATDASSNANNSNTGSGTGNNGNGNGNGGSNGNTNNGNGNTSGNQSGNKNKNN